MISRVTHTAEGVQDYQQSGSWMDGIGDPDAPDWMKCRSDHCIHKASIAGRSYIFQTMLVPAGTKRMFVTTARKLGCTITNAEVQDCAI